MEKKPKLCLSQFIATGFYSGFFPGSPGTAGSAAAVVAWQLLHYNGLLSSVYSEMMAAVIVAVVGGFATHDLLQKERARLGSGSTEDDPQIVVIDEWAGMFISLIGVPAASWPLLFVAFALFRAFDILKPGPIRRLEKLPGAIGIMADDILAGLCASALMHLIMWAII